MNEMDQKLQNLAAQNWAKFVVLMGQESLLAAKAKILRSEGKSYQQIMIKLNMTKSQVRYACKEEVCQNLSPFLIPDDATVEKQC